MIKRYTSYKIPTAVQYREYLDYITPNYYISNTSISTHILTLPNIPLTVKLEGTEVMGRYGSDFFGNAHIEDKCVKLCMKRSVVMEAIERTGIPQGGLLPDKYKWIQISGNFILVRIGGDDYKEAIQNVEVNNLPKLKAIELKPGGIYMNGINRMHLYVGCYYVLELGLWSTQPAVWLDMVRKMYFGSEIEGDESKERLQDLLNSKQIRKAYRTPTLRKFVRGSGLTESELQTIIMTYKEDETSKLITGSFHSTYLQYVALTPNRRSLTVSPFKQELLTNRLKDPIMMFLTLEELPQYLTHEVETVRKAAKRRVNQLTKKEVRYDNN